MKKADAEKKYSIGALRFSASLLWVYFIVLLIMSGVHEGLRVFVSSVKIPVLVQIAIPLGYWMLVAAGLTLFTRRRVKATYEEPMQNLARAAKQVADGDFSVFVPPAHAVGEKDYLDMMIADFNRMVEELGSVETLKTDFVSNVSHELKTPITVIQSNAEMLKLENLTKEQRAECTEHILQSTRRLSSLITNILKLNKLDKQAIASLPQIYNLSEQLCECAIQYETIWESKGIDFIADIEDCAEVEADQELLALVWNNLLSNAFKFTSSGGTVTVRQTSDFESVTVSVSDTGCGMEEETKKHIFSRFYQGDTSHATEGNGLGLALVKRVLELEGGTIHVESTPGVGSTFQVSLPRVCLKDGEEEHGFRLHPGKAEKNRQEV